MADANAWCNIGTMHYLNRRIFLPLILICLVVEANASDVMLQCMDAKGVEKRFLIFKENQKVQLYLDNGESFGSYRETTNEYIFSFPKTANRSKALVKFDRYTGMLEFETGTPPYLTILWTANCSVLSDFEKF